ncbi:MAG: hypothetical protein EXX96DRAFT_608183 [Benjaminiella poitrasii]|nr:MAG: hypothetical protein EXX96DRAFT_608183 [Benjaminiella poitrasii]
MYLNIHDNVDNSMEQQVSTLMKWNATSQDDIRHISVKTIKADMIAGIVIGIVTLMLLFAFILWKSYSICDSIKRKRKKVHQDPVRQHRYIQSVFNKSTTSFNFIVDRPTIPNREIEEYNNITKNNVSTIYSKGEDESILEYYKNSIYHYNTRSPVSSSTPKETPESQSKPFSLSLYIEPTTDLLSSSQLLASANSSNNDIQSTNAIEPNNIQTPSQLYYSRTKGQKNYSLENESIPTIIVRSSSLTNKSVKKEIPSAEQSNASPVLHITQYLSHNRYKDDDTVTINSSISSVNHSLMQDIDKNLLRISMVDTLENKSVNSIQYIGFNSTMDVNYEKADYLGIKNDQYNNPSTIYY